jgi:hypothetical protein
MPPSSGLQDEPRKELPLLAANLTDHGCNTFLRNVDERLSPIHGITRQEIILFALEIFFSHGVRLSPLGTAATTGQLYRPQMIDDDCRAIGRIGIGRRNRSTGRKPAPVPLCSP